MKTRMLIVTLVSTANALIFSPQAFAQGGSVGGFGGLAVGSAGSPSLFGGTVSVELTPQVRAIGEVGRVADVLPSTIGSLIAFTPVDLHVAAVYGEGGVRFVPAPAARVSPYLEATAGIARLRTGFSGAGSSVDPFVRAALRFFDTTEPLAGVGGGVLFTGGPVVVDIGYRYKKIFTSGTLEDVLSGGEGLHSHQARVGVGVRF